MPQPITLSPTHLAYGERPFRREPGTVPPDGDIYEATTDERAAAVRAALDAGITYFHAAYEREMMSLGASLQTLGIREQITLSTTDGDVLDRCPDTETGAAEAIRRAIARKLELLDVDTIDVFSVYDFRADVHTPARLAGARIALSEAMSAGQVRHIGATCYTDFDALTQVIQTDTFPLDIVAARFNYFDQSAMTHLLPLCRAKGITTLAAQTFSWLGGVPFVRFPNTWRYRNLTKNFYGFTAAQAHLHWVLHQPNIDAVLISMQTPAQITENVETLEIEKTPAGMESLFDSFAEAITATREGWRGLLTDELWEYRAAAEAYLHRKQRP